VEDCISRRSLLYDRNGEEHYNIISALHKSMRNSDPDAAIYWLARMLDGGEDPIYIARRLIEFAGDDVGLADPNAQVMATSCFYACKNMGMPECRYALAETVAYLALAPRSNSIAMAIDQALSDVRNSPAEPVPLHIRNAPTKLMKNLGYGKGYEYAEGTEEKITRMQCLPDSLKDRRYYEPGDRGNEVYYRKKLDAIRDWRAGKREDPPK
jgi:putative ATPase